MSKKSSFKFKEIITIVTTLVTLSLREIVLILRTLKNKHEARVKSLLIELIITFLVVLLIIILIYQINCKNFQLIIGNSLKKKLSPSK